MDLLERNFKIRVSEDLKSLNGEEFERFSRYILELVLNEKVVHKGQNLCAKPVGYTADFANTQYDIIGQSGTDEGYFDDFKKPLRDIQSALNNHSTAKKIYLFSNRYAGTSRLGDLIKSAQDSLIIQKIFPFDSEKIAETILDKIIASHTIEEIFKYLPTANELYKILPKTSQTPAHKDQYYVRGEETKIIDQLNNKSIIQIYGLSGIGKTEITISIANKVAKEYQTVIWIEGDSIQNTKIDFNAIKVSKFDRLINLATILETFKVLVVFDNINTYTSELVEAFVNYNQTGSRCIISSIAKSINEDLTFQLLEVSDTIANKILFGDNIILKKTESNKILSYTGKHPLILKIIQSAVKNGILDWAGVLIELEGVNQLTDKDRNQTISNRIIGRIKAVNEKELESLNYINNRLISKPLLNKLIGFIGVNKLLDNSIIGKDDAKYFSVHQILLDSIKSELTNKQWVPEFNQKIKIYLTEHNETKDVGFYSVIFNHDDLLTNLLNATDDEDFKRIIVYSIIQCTDIKNSSKTDALYAKANALIADNNTYYENLLFIEAGEIRLLRIDKKVEKEHYRTEAKKEIDALTTLLNTVTENIHKATILHHIGKLQLKLGENELATNKFEEVLRIKPDDPFALLQVARIASNTKQTQRVVDITNFIFKLKDCPLSILLSFYELISQSNYQDLKAIYIDDQIDLFTLKIIEAIDSRYDQPYNILGKMSRHLSYNFPEYFETIIDSLPAPSNLDYNENLRFNYALILSSYYKFGDITKQPQKMERALLLAKANLSQIDLNNDYQKGIYVDLLIANQEFDLALEKIDEFEDENEFYFQKLSKIYRGMHLFNDAIEAANNAINYHKGTGRVSDIYLSAFLNDKAEAEDAHGDKNCMISLSESISLQTNSKTKKQWQSKLEEWKIKYK
jgi:hypothetical protein